MIKSAYTLQCLMYYDLLIERSEMIQDASLGSVGGFLDRVQTPQ